MHLNFDTITEECKKYGKMVNKFSSTFFKILYVEKVISKNNQIKIVILYNNIVLAILPFENKRYFCECSSTVNRLF